MRHMSSEFLFDSPSPSCYKTETTYGFTHPEKLRDRPCDASATVQAVPTSADRKRVREMRDDMRSARRLSFERLFIFVNIRWLSRTNAVLVRIETNRQHTNERLIGTWWSRYGLTCTAPNAVRRTCRPLDHRGRLLWK
jgi:hypothetical protein